VFISRWHNGSPAHRYGLYALYFLTEVNGAATPDLATFIGVVRSLVRPAAARPVLARPCRPRPPGLYSPGDRGRCAAAFGETSAYPAYPEPEPAACGRAQADGAFVRVKLVHVDGSATKVIAIKQDLLYWPTWELRLDRGAAAWRRTVLAPASKL